MINSMMKSTISSFVSILPSAIHLIKILLTTPFQADRRYLSAREIPVPGATLF